MELQEIENRYLFVSYTLSLDEKFCYWKVLRLHQCKRGVPEYYVNHKTLFETWQEGKWKKVLPHFEVSRYMCKHNQKQRKGCSIISGLQTHCYFKTDFQNVDQHVKMSNHEKIFGGSLTLVNTPGSPYTCKGRGLTNFVIRVGRYTLDIGQGRLYGKQLFPM